MTSFVYNEDTWKEIKKKFVYNESTWKAVKKAWTYSNDEWKKVYSSGPIILCSLPLHSDLEFEVGTGAVTFTRSSPATYIDSSGILQEVDANVPRFKNNMLLIEGKGTNFARRTNNLDNENWWPTYSIYSISDMADAPDGTPTATGLVPTVGWGSHHISQYMGDSDGTVSGSCFVKKGSGVNWFVMHLNYNTASGVEFGMEFFFNIANGTVGTMPIGGLHQEIEELADGWFRCKCTGTYDGTGIQGIYFLLGPAENDGDEHFEVPPGTVTTYIWGPQFEEFIRNTSYIPNDLTDPIDRDPDILSFPQIGNMPEWDQPVAIELNIHPLLRTQKNARFFSTSNLYQIMEHSTDLQSYLSYWCDDSNPITFDFDFSNLTNVKQTLEATTVTTYINGEQKASGPLQPIESNNPGTIWLGSDQGADFYYYGYISDLIISAP